MTTSLESLAVRVSMSAILKNQLTSSPNRFATAAMSLDFAPRLLSGTDFLQANKAWDYAATLTSGSSLTIDLYDFAGIDNGGGSGKDNLGQAIALDEVVAILITNSTVDDGTSDSDPIGLLEIEPDATNGWTPIGVHTVATGGALDAGGVLLKVQTNVEGFLIADGSSHRIKLTASGGDVDFQILLLGREL